MTDRPTERQAERRLHGSSDQRRVARARPTHFCLLLRTQAKFPADLRKARHEHAAVTFVGIASHTCYKQEVNIITAKRLMDALHHRAGVEPLVLYSPLPSSPTWPCPKEQNPSHLSFLIRKQRSENEGLTVAFLKRLPAKTQSPNVLRKGRFPHRSSRGDPCRLAQQGHCANGGRGSRKPGCRGSDLFEDRQELRGTSVSDSSGDSILGLSTQTH